jgi:hypothetical protein
LADNCQRPFSVHCEDESNLGRETCNLLNCEGVITLRKPTILIFHNNFHRQCRAAWALADQLAADE